MTPLGLCDVEARECKRQPYQSEDVGENHRRSSHGAIIHSLPSEAPSFSMTRMKFEV